ncbi:heterokaryon incompatibility protein-domain-containing protein [Podospora australis]|uniref:Heterokaryon incompatibility protein-domain-containing protein n=1 Tax=Podospora australis TaxID=1536484 RepID=A0AAN7AE11_9PEZI|nr:heterokaryon incompatibility protein-domain-containing protein [Podospora australis]
MSSIYTPLNPLHSEIRLLVIHPGKDADPIHCSLQHTSLEEPRDFEALSYVWGSEENLKVVSVENFTFEVTINLHAALRRLRKPTESRSIWADAICINQQDIEEKNYQLPLVGRIYTEATNVVVWLGEKKVSTVSELIPQLLIQCRLRECHVHVPPLSCANRYKAFIPVEISTAQATIIVLTGQ